MENPKIKNHLSKIKNPIIKGALYLFILMGLGIAAIWVLLGVMSPVLLALLIMKW